MENKKNLTRALGGILVGGMLLSGGIAFAGDANSQSTKIPGKTPSVTFEEKRPGMMNMNKGPFKVARPAISPSAIDQLVKDGVITSDKASEIKAYIDKASKEKQARCQEIKKLNPAERKALLEKNRAESQGKTPVGKAGLFNDLVKNNILTQQQADTIKTKLKENAQKQKLQQTSESLKALVGKGTITQEQADTVLEGFAAAQKDREELWQKIQGMTKAERRQYLQTNQGNLQHPLNQLVTTGIINQEQAKAIKKELFNKNR